MSQSAFKPFGTVALLEIYAYSRVLGDFDVRKGAFLAFGASALCEMDAMLHRVGVDHVT